MGLCQSRTKTKTSNTIRDNNSTEYNNFVEISGKYNWILYVKNTYDIDSHLFECKACKKQFCQKNNSFGSCEFNGLITHHSKFEDDKVFYAIIKSNQPK